MLCAADFSLIMSRVEGKSGAGWDGAVKGRDARCSTLSTHLLAVVATAVTAAELLK